MVNITTFTENSVCHDRTLPPLLKRDRVLDSSELRFANDGLSGNSASPLNEVLLKGRHRLDSVLVGVCDRLPNISVTSRLLECPSLLSFAKLPEYTEEARRIERL